MSELTWVDVPPPDNRKRNQRPGVVEQLKQRPGEWALVETDAKASRATSYKKLGCEAVSRKRPEHRNTALADIYARWPESEG